MLFGENRKNVPGGNSVGEKAEIKDIESEMTGAAAGPRLASQAVEMEQNLSCCSLNLLSYPFVDYPFIAPIFAFWNSNIFFLRHYAFIH